MGRRAALGILAALAGLAAFVFVRGARDDPPRERRPAIEVRVLILNFDPLLADSGRRRLHDAFGWNDPRTLARDFVDDVRRASGGLVRYHLAEWRDLDEFPPKRDGFLYTAASYTECWHTRARCHEPDGVDYLRVLAAQEVAGRIDSGAIDEVWLFGGPYFGYWESAMAGPRSFEINGGTYPEVPTRGPFAVMGFNYERGVAEMLEDLCHRTEATLARVYGGWNAESLTTTWARFAATAAQSDGVAGVGSCHVPPNGKADYDYANEASVMSDAEDWLRYPALTGTKRSVSRDAWGGPDYHRNYFLWWFRHLPRVAGVNADGRLNNWWRYVYDLDRPLVNKVP